MKLLIVEDEYDLLDSMYRYLVEEGFLCEKAEDYFSAEDKLATQTYDVVVLDITLPDGNGLSLLEDLKKRHPGTGVLIVSARNSLDDKISGLNLGADDYLTKPVHLAELNARIHAVIRRKHFEGSSFLHFNEVTINTLDSTVTINNKITDLTKKEYDLLLYLMINKNRIIPKDALAEHLWGDHIDLAENFDFIYTHVKNLRRKLADKGCENYLKTIYGMGYQFTDQ
jgi:DNA-binding response OmpR family regulator